MQTLSPPDAVKSLLAFDFDGTLHDPPSGAVINADFFEAVEQARQDRGVHWGICTGRSLGHLVEGLVEGRFRFLPDFVVPREREIFRPGPFSRWLPDEKWNRRCEREHHKLFRKGRKVLRRIREFVEDHTKARWVEESGDPAGIVASSVDEMDAILRFALGELEALPDLSYERNGIYLRFNHTGFSKGTALTHLAQTEGVAADAVLAVGDNANDLSMLHRDVAGQLGCPSNSIPEVKERVHGHGGVVANSPGCHGVVEVMAAYL